MLPVHNRIANQEVKESVVSGLDSPAYVGFIGRNVAEKKLGLSDELFRQICNHVTGFN